MPQSHPTQPERKSGQSREKQRTAAGARLEDRTREDLFELARELRIPGFAEMSKPELIEAIRRR